MMKGYEDLVAGLVVLATVLIGGYSYLQSEAYQQKRLEKQEIIESKTHEMIPPVVDWSKFEAAVKHTE